MQPAADPSHPAAPDLAAPDLAERRLHPRYDVAWPVVVSLQGAASLPAQICNISEGGARIRGLPALAPSTRALLRFEHLVLLVPCVVVGQRGPDEISVRFELEGMGKREFLKQLSRITGQAIPPAAEDA